MPVKLLPKPVPVNSVVVVSVCNRCKRLCSRRGALVASVRGRERLLCAKCSDEFCELFSETERHARFGWMTHGGAA